MKTIHKKSAKKRIRGKVRKDVRMRHGIAMDDDTTTLILF